MDRERSALLMLAQQALENKLAISRTVGRQIMLFKCALERVTIKCSSSIPYSTLKLLKKYIKELVTMLSKIASSDFLQCHITGV
jgi:hypothetical protein